MAKKSKNDFFTNFFEIFKFGFEEIDQTKC